MWPSKKYNGKIRKGNNTICNYCHKNKIFLIDGFPRNKENFEGWLEVFKDECQILAVLFIECPESVCSSRICKRQNKSNRIDDNIESIKKRFDVFQNETLANLESLEKHTQILKINGDQMIEDVFQDVEKELHKIFSC
jgi:UMP-CMP kinase